ncbi:MAG: substrate-binding domain-containing protein [Anaerolineae bacterium]
MNQKPALTFALLGLLAEGERYGYDLKRQVDREFAPFWQIDYAQLYRSLARFTREGWVQVRVEPGRGGPARKVYSLTTDGRAAFARWLIAPTAARDEFLVKACLASTTGLPFASPPQARGQAWEEKRAGWLAALQIAREVGDGPGWVMADTALRDMEVARAALDLCEAMRSVDPAGHAVAPAPLLISGSDDPLLARLVRQSHASIQVVGSLGGLLALSRREADVAGIHMLDMDTGEYNVPYVRRLLPEDELILVNLAFRENGLLLAPGNPKNIRTLRDLMRPGVRLMNRSPGAGTRLLLALRLRAAQIDPHSLRDWDRAVGTHAAVAAAVSSGAADAGPGLRAIAAEWGLEFVSLGEERFDLVVPRREFDSPRVQSLLDAMHDQEFRRAAAGLAGYDLSQSGRVIARI